MEFPNKPTLDEEKIQLKEYQKRKIEKIEKMQLENNINKDKIHFTGFLLITIIFVIICNTTHELLIPLLINFVTTMLLFIKNILHNKKNNT